MRQTLTTPRLILRPLRAEDAPDITRLIGEWEVMRWLTAPPWPYRLADAEDFLALELAQECYAITSGGTFMGVVGIHDRGRYPGGELGYWLGSPFHGQGYMTEAARAAADAHFASGAATLYSGYVTGNQASANVLTKLGFQVAGTHETLSRPLGRDVMVQEVVLHATDRRPSDAA